MSWLVQADEAVPTKYWLVIFMAFDNSSYLMLQGYTCTNLGNTETGPGVREKVMSLESVAFWVLLRHPSGAVL